VKVIWTEEALEKLSTIEEFIGTDSPERAKTFIDYLIMKGESISENRNTNSIRGAQAASNR